VNPWIKTDRRKAIGENMKTEIERGNQRRKTFGEKSSRKKHRGQSLGKIIRENIGEDHKEKHEGEKNETSKGKTRKSH
jgi:hypothetical protein